MNDQQIYVLLATRPGVRAVQIADSLDAELTDVSAALRSLVDVGDVVKTKGEAPNGQQALFYELSEEFKRTKTGREILDAVKVAAAAAAAPAAPAAATPTPAPASSTSPARGGKHGCAKILAAASRRHVQHRRATGRGCIFRCRWR